MMYISTSGSHSTMAFAIAINSHTVHNHPAASAARPVSFTQAGAFQATKNNAMRSNVTIPIPNGSEEKTKLKRFDSRVNIAINYYSLLQRYLRGVWKCKVESARTGVKSQNNDLETTSEYVFEEECVFLYLG